MPKVKIIAQSQYPCPNSESVPKVGIFAQGQNLCPKSESLPKVRILAQGQDPCRRSRSLPKNQNRCPKSEPLPKVRILAQSQDLCPKSESLPKIRIQNPRSKSKPPIQNPSPRFRIHAQSPNRCPKSESLPKVRTFAQSQDSCPRSKSLPKVKILARATILAKDSKSLLTIQNPRKKKQLRANIATTRMEMRRNLKMQMQNFAKKLRKSIIQSKPSITPHVPTPTAQHQIQDKQKRTCNDAQNAYENASQNNDAKSRCNTHNSISTKTKKIPTGVSLPLRSENMKHTDQPTNCTNNTLKPMLFEQP